MISFLHFQVWFPDSLYDYPKPQLKSAMEEMIKLCFNKGDKELMGTTRYNAIWANVWEKYRLSFNKRL